MSFNDLIEVAVVAAARHADVPMRAIRHAIDAARELYRVDRPLMLLRFMHDGREVFARELDGQDRKRYVNLSRRGQLAWEHVQDVLSDLDYAEDVAYRWWPAGKDKPLVIDPAISFGRPYVVGRGVSTDAVRSRFRGGESLESIAEDFDLTVAEAEAALRFELASAA